MKTSRSRRVHIPTPFQVHCGKSAKRRQSSTRRATKAHWYVAPSTQPSYALMHFRRSLRNAPRVAISQRTQRRCNYGALTRARRSFIPCVVVFLSFHQLLISFSVRKLSARLAGQQLTSFVLNLGMGVMYNIPPIYTKVTAPVDLVWSGLNVHACGAKERHDAKAGEDAGRGCNGRLADGYGVFRESVLFVRCVDLQPISIHTWRNRMPERTLKRGGEQRCTGAGRQEPRARRVEEQRGAPDKMSVGQESHGCVNRPWCWRTRTWWCACKKCTCCVTLSARVSHNKFHGSVAPLLQVYLHYRHVRHSKSSAASCLRSGPEQGLVLPQPA